MLSPNSCLRNCCLRSAVVSGVFKTGRMGSTEASKKAQKKPKIKGVVFDMDGTLTVPVIDFALMKRKVLGEGRSDFKPSDTSRIDILHQIEQWEPERQEKAYSIITSMEREAQEKLQIMPGALELCEMLDSRQIRRGLITRNIKESVDLFHSRFGMKEFTPALSREFRPYKPDPAPLQHICASWEVVPNEIMMVGDSLADDVVCGNRAGSFTCLLDESGKYNTIDESQHPRPDFKVKSLSELLMLLQTEVELTA
eukprot:TRINITY_DN31289_c0_g1_i1.p1 TRINITY_DN31289_c0_g1~~TRINITY_DN31289_c0_g1_i1.p1  ORF type:complete len:254 (-),score=38.64 TRINITY_DN31289_c0_g1_i1:118-879(-)